MANRKEGFLHRVSRLAAPWLVVGIAVVHPPTRPAHYFWVAVAVTALHLLVERRVAWLATLALALSTGWRLAPLGLHSPSGSWIDAASGSASLLVLALLVRQAIPSVAPARVDPSSRSRRGATPTGVQSLSGLARQQMRLPLSGILGLTEELLQGELSPSQRELVDLVRGSAALLRAELDEIVDSPDRARSSHPPSRRLVAPDLLLQECLTLLEPLARDRGVTMHVRTLDQKFEVLLGDADRIRRLFLHLIAASQKSGAERVDFELEQQSSSNSLESRVVLGARVAFDQDRERLARWMLPEAELSPLEEQPGHRALDVRLASRLARRLGGELRWVPDSSGAGGLLAAEVPLFCPPPSGGAQGAKLSRNQPRFARLPKRVLVVSVQPIRLAMISRAVTALGLVSDSTTSLAGASLLYDPELHELLLVDLAEPTEEARRFFETRVLPYRKRSGLPFVVGLTWKSSEELDSDPLPAHVDRLLGLPWSSYSLREALSEHFQVSAPPELNSSSVEESGSCPTLP